jgi:uncharacterized protein (DUF2141 family)
MSNIRKLLLAAAVVGLVGAAPPATFKLSGHIVGASGKSPVYVALWQADGFLQRPAQTVRMAAGDDLVFHFDVPAGRWAVSAFEDTNGNGRLDMGGFGPEEPSGFWRPFDAPRAPRFEDVDSLISRDISNADVRLK